MGPSRTKRRYRIQLVQFLDRLRVARGALRSAGRVARKSAVFLGVGGIGLGIAPAARGANEPEVEVTVVGERRALEHSRANPTVASTVLSGEALHEAGQSTAEVLARVPGVQVLRTGAQSDLATASIRGADSSQVPVYLAGIRLNDDVSGSADLSTVPLWMIERAEVYRGNAPEYADRLGMGGAIFFWPRRPRTTRAGAGGQVGSFGERGGWLAYEAGTARAGSIVAVRRTQAENDYPFLNDQGRRFDVDEVEERRKNADFVAHDAWAIGRYELDGGARLSLVVHAFDRDQGITGVSVIPAEHSRGTVRRYLAGASARLPCSAGEGCRVELQASLLAARVTLADPLSELPALQTRLLHNAGTRHVYSARWATAPHERLEVGLSALTAFEDLAITRANNLPRDGERASTRLAATAGWNVFGPVDLHLLAAGECHTTRGRSERFGRAVVQNGETCGVLEPSGRLGASVRVLQGLEAIANVARYVRVPTLGELYGSAPNVEGNPEIVPEEGWTTDAGLRATARLPSRSGTVSLETFVFARYASDLIRFRRTSLQTLGPYNVGSARVLGVESALGSELFGMLRVDAAATALDPKETTADPVEDPTPNDVLPLTSRLVATVRVEPFAKPGLSMLAQDRVGLALTYLHRSSRFYDPAGLTVLPAQNLFDLEATTSHWDGRLLGRVAVRNVFDARQLDLIGLPIPGRSFHGEIEAWW